jgi:hypothetical protein
VAFHVDYFKITIFEQADTVLQMVEMGLLEPMGLPLGGWVDKGAFHRWEHIYTHGSGVTILVPKDGRVTYTMVEIKGQGCVKVGMEGLRSFMSRLNVTEVRWRGRRIDLAFDFVHFTPHLVDAAIRAGNFNSRCLNVSDRDWNDSDTGQTAYLGTRQTGKARRLRVYNRRGYVRCEGELRKDWASAAARDLSKAPLEAWPSIALAHLRGMVDFVDRKANERVERCPLLPWWAEFVGGADRIRNLPAEDRRKAAEDAVSHVIGKSEGRIIRCARILWPIIEAFGIDYVHARIKHHGLPRITDEDRAFLAELLGYRHCGLAGLSGDPPSADDGIPF